MAAEVSLNKRLQELFSPTAPKSPQGTLLERVKGAVVGGEILPEKGAANYLPLVVLAAGLGLVIWAIQQQRVSPVPQEWLVENDEEDPESQQPQPNGIRSGNSWP